MELGKSWDIFNHLYGLGFYMGQHAGPTVESQGQIVLAPQKAVDGANKGLPGYLFFLPGLFVLSSVVFLGLKVMIM